MADPPLIRELPGIAIVGTRMFSHHTAFLGFYCAPRIHQIIPGGCLSVGNPSLGYSASLVILLRKHPAISPSRSIPTLPPRASSHQIVPGGCSSVGNSSQLSPAHGIPVLPPRAPLINCSGRMPALGESLSAIPSTWHPGHSTCLSGKSLPAALGTRHSRLSIPSNHSGRIHTRDPHGFSASHTNTFI